MAKPLFDRVALVGIGLIGSSFARVVRREGLARHVAVSTRSAATLRRAEELDLGDSYHLDPRDAVRDAFPQMEEVADPPSLRFRIPAGLDGIFQAPTADEFAALRAAADTFRKAGATARANALIAATTSQDIRARLASLLLNLSVQFGEPVEKGIRISLRLTNQEMANMIATTRETVNRTLNRFWDEKLVDMRTSHVVIVDPDRLRALVP